MTHLSINTAEQGFISLKGRDAVLSLWYHDSTLENFFLQKVTKKEQNIDIVWENKERKTLE